MSTATNANESYCTFTLASDTTAGGLPSQEEIAKQLESSDPKVSYIFHSRYCSHDLTRLEKRTLGLGVQGRNILFQPTLLIHGEPRRCEQRVKMGAAY